MDDRTKLAIQTSLLHNGDYVDGTVNPPVQHASTLRAPDYLSFIGKKPWQKTYGRYGLQTHRALEDAVSLAENAHATLLTSSGMHAVSLSLTSCLRPGDHVLLTDNVYDPVKIFARNILTRMNIAYDYYNPLLGAEALSKLILPNTRMLYMESPGSGTFECHDTLALLQCAKTTQAIICVMDNSWGTGVFHKPLQLGCDISLTAGTKYISGHSDILLGTVSVASADLYQQIFLHSKCHGYYVAPDEAYLGLRGIRTLAVRLKQHQENAQEIVAWLKQRDEVGFILHPAETQHWGAKYFQRDFTGSSGLFGFYLREADQDKLAVFFAHLQLFSLGYSWGGYESLLIPVKLDPDDAKLGRAASPYLPKYYGQTLLRIHVGLENVQDLIADLAGGFAAMNAFA